MTNSEITLVAREKLTGKWLPAILAFIIITVISSLNLFTKSYLSTPFDFPFIDQYTSHTTSLSFNYGNIFTILLGGALAYGGSAFSLNFVRGNDPNLEMVFSGFKNTNRFFVLLASNILITVITLALCVLLIVPGIIAGLALSMTFFILVDNPELGSLDAMKQSRALMDGHKWQLFTLYLRFIALGFLCILTLGIGFIWLIPYANICTAQFYDNLLE